MMRLDQYLSGAPLYNPAMPGMDSLSDVSAKAGVRLEDWLSGAPEAFKTAVPVARAYIEKNGGEVIGIHALGAAQFSTKLKPSIDTLKKLNYTYGEELNSVLSGIFGEGINAEDITESQARTLINNKAEIINARRAQDAAGVAPRGPQNSKGVFQKQKEINNARTNNTNTNPDLSTSEDNQDFLLPKKHPLDKYLDDDK